MKRQLKDHDEVNLYLADGIIKLYKLKKVEVLLLETSSHFGSQDKAKSSFDHHKDLFGVLAMLKTVADEFYLGSVSTFSKLKLFFVHASGKSLYLWSMKFVQEGPAYELWLEGAHEINTSFEEKVEQLPKAITFFWMMKAMPFETNGGSS
ncbi:hypothetical protein RO3G_15228 [Rhizopus delemar RA 99-880]|uniref:Uncharacterized protein n=1 Tax=Rhizopus delemar (strain RA 99-880 / ATCC MYA-4621 / FGSC 9543 / NRRL 43880) TaxID=246409 RepID=I1CPY7_RHIO9|nr:hypothetical protein RO3G_15228 [Rhizopus delemar RA 99-880]|eukprot:EIE90517.1 hypothetical protein RO3G_15228 [Rhizopus delemar RA 99-880]